MAQHALACNVQSVAAARAKGDRLTARCRSSNYGIKNDASSSPSSFPSSSCVIITGSSSLYFPRIKNLLGSIMTHASATTAVVYDLGLTDAQIDEITSWGFKVERLGVSSSGLHGRAGEGWDKSSYAFKPQVILHAVSKYGCVLWLDSSFEIHAPLTCVFDQILEDGLLLSVNSWLFPSVYAHRATLERFGVWHPSSEQSKQQEKIDQLPLEIQSGIVGVSSTHQHIVDMIIKPWAECARQPECIAPEGSDKSNHRQDQTVLNAIVVSLGRRAGMPSLSSSSSASSSFSSAAASFIAALPVSGNIFAQVNPSHDASCIVQCVSTLSTAADTRKCSGGCAGYERQETVSGSRGEMRWAPVLYRAVYICRLPHCGLVHCEF